MSKLPECPMCGSEHTYEDRNLIVCPQCAHEWTAADKEREEEESAVKDAHGTILEDGDDVIVIKDLKVKGSSTPIKKGTKVNSIRIIDGDHDIDCKIPNFGSMQLKSEFVKKA